MSLSQKTKPQNSSPNQGLDRILNSRFFFYVFLASFVITSIFLLFSSLELFNVRFSLYLSEYIAPYFWIFLLFVGRQSMAIPHLHVPMPGVTVYNVVLVMVILYVLFFAVMLITSFFKNQDRTLSSNSTIFYGAMTTFGLFLSLVVIAIERNFGIPIGGGGIVNNSEKYLSYINLIYAPFVEELGFRIIPLGIYAMVLVSLYRPFKKDVLLSFLAPGYVRRKYGLKLGWVGYALIIITSAAFGYAHVLFGVWDWGKFLQAALVGVILAFGYLEFGIFVDVPMHWFYNGVLTLNYIAPGTAPFIDIASIWFLFSGVVATLFLVLFLVKRVSSGAGKSAPTSP